MIQERKRYIRKDRIEEYLSNLERQLSRLSRLSVPNASYFMNHENFERINAIKFTLACAIQNVTRVAVHIATALGIKRMANSEADLILALEEGEVIPREFAERIKGMPSFRNRLIHDYLPSEFDAERLYDALQRLDDFRHFARHVVEWLEKEV